jgi:hypothetical protein
MRITLITQFVSASHRKVYLHVRREIVLEKKSIAGTKVRRHSKTLQIDKSEKVITETKNQESERMRGLLKEIEKVIREENVADKSISDEL